MYANRRWIRGKRGERSIAHALETGGMCWVHLRGRDNITKRHQIQIGGLNLGVVMRKKYKVGTPRGWRIRGMVTDCPVLNGGIYIGEAFFLVSAWIEEEMPEKMTTWIPDLHSRNN